MAAPREPAITRKPEAHANTKRQCARKRPTTKIPMGTRLPQLGLPHPIQAKAPKADAQEGSSQRQGNACAMESVLAIKRSASGKWIRKSTEEAMGWGMLGKATSELRTGNDLGFTWASCNRLASTSAGSRCANLQRDTNAN